MADFVTLSDAKLALKIDATDATDDELLADLIANASAGALDNLPSRLDVPQVAEERTHRLYDETTIFPRGRLTSVTAVTDGDGTALTYETIEDPDGVVLWIELDSKLDGKALVTGTWGWPAVPAQLSEAVLLAVEIWYKRRRDGQGDAGLIGRVSAWPDSARELIEDFVRKHMSRP